MSDYQRFISYIYEYKNQEKTHNCGFCKVEFRNKLCKLEIHMKSGPYPYNPEFRVYTFISRNNRLHGIELGKARYQQGSTNGTFSFSEKELINNYSLKELGGIFIESDTKQIFASAWKDYEICPDLFLSPDDLLSTTPTQDSLEDSSPDLLDNTQDLPIHAASVGPETLLYTKPVSPKTPELPKEVEHTEVSLPAEILDSTQDSTDDIQDFTDTINIQPPVTSPNDHWEVLQQTYPHVQPFFDDEIHNLLQFSCEDMDYLSTLGIVINKNRFFQHACDNFHHFLIGFTTEENTPILAIPGFYSELEHYLASAFGFSQFKSARNERNFPSQFVYWIRPL